MQKKRNEKAPHYGVFTRIRRSRRGGVGVFAITDIKRGTPLFYGDDDEIVWISKARLRRLPKEIRRLYDDFCIITNQGQTYGCPANFNRLTTPWYLNSSSRPNVGCDKDYRFLALRDIKAGEELTVDYSTYNEFDPRANLLGEYPIRNKIIACAKRG